MSFQTTALKYGWVYLTALGVITGTTIYVVNNTRQQVKPEDIIEIVLGTYERCLATQTSTNPIYSVSPANLIQSWVKTNATALTCGTAYRVCYTSYWPSTTGVGAVQSYTSSVQPSINYAASWTATIGWVWTNKATWPTVTITDAYEVVTNTIGWFPDRDYMITLDTTIKALVPYYVDTNTVYDGTTNIVMLTVTGLWASLQIGDKTNKFTREPAWTNPVSTNWVVNYTSYWPSTNGTATNINYTSDYRQVVNYAQSWTATGGHVWVTSSNWASSVVTVTNAATYGDYPWQIYVEDLQERYKVLNALKYQTLGYPYSGTTNFIGITRQATIQAYCEKTNIVHVWYESAYVYNGGPVVDLGPADGSVYSITVDKRSDQFEIVMPQVLLSQEIEAYPVSFKGGMRLYFTAGWSFTNDVNWSATFKLLDSPNNVKIYGLGISYAENFTNITKSYTDSQFDISAKGLTGGSGWHYMYAVFYPIVNFPFNYCTNKYW